MSATDVKKIVRERYGSIATKETGCCAPSAESCCGGDPGDPSEVVTSKAVGYSKDDLSEVPDGANLGLGCGNPVALASLEAGETVLDLGSGGGFDCFLAANRVGAEGHVIGVDMTPEMLERARGNAKKGGYSNVEFRRGEIEKLPVDDGTVDVVISNCVINLSPDKESVFKEINRVLKPGGRFYVSDMVLSDELPDVIRKSGAAYSACIAGAILRDDYIAKLGEAGLEDINILDESTFPFEVFADDPLGSSLLAELENVSAEDIQKAANSLISMKVSGSKPA